MREIGNGLLVAFGLYSALPMPQVEWKKNTMRLALCFLPLIGLLIGLGQLGWLRLALWLRLSPILYAAGAVLLPVALTGGIHLDGFADTCDALCSFGDREKRLEILKDPHIGAFGVLWLLVLLLVQFGLFAQLYDVPDCAMLCSAGYVLARALGGYLVVGQPCAKKSGLAHLFAENAEKRTVVRVMGIWTAACAAGLAVCGKWFGVLTAAAVLCWFVYHTRRCRAVFGGVTGDLCGMCITVSEMLALAGAVIGGLCLR